LPDFTTNSLKRLRSVAVLLAAAVACLGLLFLLLSRWPGAGAQLATPLRRLVGNERVGQLETIFFRAEDRLRRWQYSAGWAEARSPWAPDTVAPPVPTPILMTATPPAASATPTATAVPAGSPLPATHRASTPVVAPLNETASPTEAATPAPSTTTPIPTATATPWNLAAVEPFGRLRGEGVWLPYLYDTDGNTVALRTFLQPDPERPYTTVAIVAFDLRRTRLHYVLGSEEPALPGGPRGQGRIPATAGESGDLLATFNGGFLATHGEYGAMQEGLVALPAKSGYGTVAIGADGRVRIGEWGREIDPNGDYLSWRQNARLILDDGQISDRVYNRSIAIWGGSIDGSIVTWRSAIGLSADEQTLYYFAGPSVSMPVLATAMQVAGVRNGILLDINATWVHFAAVRYSEDRPIAEPLFAEGMDTNADRYLRQSARDFFYVTVQQDRR
jgi:hypothetical protein